MKRIVIVHGWDGGPTKDWIGWASDAFRKLGYEVVTPEMPETERPVMDRWVRHLAAVSGPLDENTYFIGHSIGCQTIMRLLAQTDIKVGGAIYVAGWFNLVNLENGESRQIAEPWITTPINAEKVKKNSGFSIAMLGDNDPWVSFDEARKDFEEKLGAAVVAIKNGGHITSDDGFGPFPQLVEIFATHV